MGRAIRCALPGAPEIVLRTCVARSGPDTDGPRDCDWLALEAFGRPDALAILPPDLVVIDVSVAAGTEHLMGVLERAPRALVEATTGLSDALEARIVKLASRVPVLRARNLSMGIAVLSAMLRALPPGARAIYDADIVEHHHAAKKDAPSGTAGALAELLKGVGTKRRGADTQVHSIRGGTTPGTHEVILSGEGETLTLGHLVHDRAVFARGALRAAEFLHGKKPALYAFEDALTET